MFKKMYLSKQLRTMRINFHIACILVVPWMLLLSLLGNAKAEAQGMENNLGPSNLSGQVLINVCEKFEKRGGLEFRLSLPDRKMTEAVQEHAEKTRTCSSASITEFHNNGKWDKCGQRIAYSAPRDEVGSRSILLIKDISKEATLLRLDLEPKSIIDVAWAPDGHYIAVLSVKASLSYNPIKLLFTLGGHPIGYRTYFVEIYDMTGTLVYRSNDDEIGTFDTGGVRILGASIAWTD